MRGNSNRGFPTHSGGMRSRESGREAGKGLRTEVGAPAGQVASLKDMRTIWVPSGAEERGYYDRLFQLADVSNTGKLAGQSAVLFLARSALAFPILKQVNNEVCAGRE